MLTILVTDRPTPADLAAIGQAVGRWSPRPASRDRHELLTSAIDAIRSVTEIADAVDVIIALADELAIAAAELETQRELVSESLALAHRQHVEIGRLRERLKDRLVSRRGAR